MGNQLPLRDIHLPASSTWWPPAPGWWLLLVFSLLLLGLCYLLLKRLRQPLLKKSAGHELSVISARFRQHGDKQLLLQELSSLLRRVGISFLGRENAAGVTGAGWYRQLNELGAGRVFTEHQITILSAAPYQPAADISSKDLANLLRQTRHWLAALPRQRGIADV